MRALKVAAGQIVRLVRCGGARLLLAGLAGWVWLAMALLGCRSSAEAVADGDDPLAALTAAVQSARYDGAFWTREAHRNSRSWRAAKVFCRQRRERRLPNCHAVELVERWDGPLSNGALRALPPLPPPPPLPPLPPAMHPNDAGQVAADAASLKAWEARLLARGKDAGAGARR